MDNGPARVATGLASLHGRDHRLTGRPRRRGRAHRSRRRGPARTGAEPARRRIERDLRGGDEPRWPGGGGSDLARVEAAVLLALADAAQILSEGFAGAAEDYRDVEVHNAAMLRRTVAA